MGRLIDLVGQTFGRLTVLRKSSRSGSCAFWDCECSCEPGKITTVRSHALMKGHTKSCGCLQREDVAARGRTHGLSKTKEYSVYLSIDARCNNPNDRSYPAYGGRAENPILMYEGWRGDGGFERFIEHVGMMPKPGMQIDRIDNSKGYFPGNVRWVTRRENINNRDVTTMLTYKGETKAVGYWSDEFGLSRSAITRRIQRGWTVERALETPSYKTSKVKSPSDIVDRNKVYPKDLTGLTFDRLTVIGQQEERHNGQIRWICQCSCEAATIKTALGTNLKGGKVRSCGCLSREQSVASNIKFTLELDDKTYTINEFCEVYGVSRKVVMTRIQKGMTAEQIVEDIQRKSLAS